MVPDRISIEWMGPIPGRMFRADAASYSGPAAARLWGALAIGASACRALATQYETKGDNPTAGELMRQHAAELQQLADAMKAEG